MALFDWGEAVVAAKQNRAVYQLKVTLRDIHPPIWRGIQVWEDINTTNNRLTLTF